MLHVDHLSHCFLLLASAIAGSLDLPCGPVARVPCRPRTLAAALSSEMPAENPRELVADERFIEFANRSLEDLFLFYVDQVVSSRSNCAKITSSSSQLQ